jgi:redox-sensitive bicupin YhaK (pirin superfamily)
MPIVHRPAAERGRTRLPWLDGRHSFSFGDYHDPSWTEWSALRVLNDDRVAAGGGFPTHPHRDMEILTWVLDGSLEHKDSMGTGAVIRPGEAQVMRAGTGVTHSEFNHSESAPVRLLQIWFPPRTHGLSPGISSALSRTASCTTSCARSCRPTGATARSSSTRTSSSTSRAWGRRQP